MTEDQMQDAVEEVTRDIDDKIANLSIDDAIAFLEWVGDDLGVRLEALNDDRRRAERDEEE